MTRQLRTFRADFAPNGKPNRTANFYSDLAIQFNFNSNQVLNPDFKPVIQFNQSNRAMTVLTDLVQRAVDFAHASPLTAVLAALALVLAAYVLLGSNDSGSNHSSNKAANGKAATAKGSVPQPGLIKLPAEKAKKVAEEFDLNALRKEFYDDPFVVYHGK